LSLGSIRRTNLMKLKEEKFSKKIDVLILDALLQSQGQFHAAARSLGVQKSTFSKWLVDLNLHRKAAQIRKSFGLHLTDVEISLRRDGEGNFVVGHEAYGPCTSCKLTADQLVEPLEALAITVEEESRGLSVVVRDGHADKHWFKLRPGVIE
jgi:hypothetical protein